MKTLTKKQFEVLQYIKNYVQTYQYAPSYREIMQHFSFTSLGTVYQYIKVLKTKGMIEAEKQKSRSMFLKQELPTKPPATGLSLPFIGYITPGEPIETFSKSLSFEVPTAWIKNPEATYILKVQGDHLRDELMADGDFLIVEARQEAHNGETVVALLHQQEVIVRKYFLENDYVRLVSQNPHNLPMILSEDDLLIQGVIMSVIRRKVS